MYTVHPTMRKSLGLWPCNGHGFNGDHIRPFKINWSKQYHIYPLWDGRSSELIHISGLLGFCSWPCYQPITLEWNIRFRVTPWKNSISMGCTRGLYSVNKTNFEWRHSNVWSLAHMQEVQIFWILKWCLTWEMIYPSFRYDASVRFLLKLWAIVLAHESES